MARLSDDDIAKIREMAAAGKGRNEIAREVGCSYASVTKWAKREGDDEVFVRGPGVIAATAAKVADAKARRADLQLKLLEDAERLRQQLFKPAFAFNFGGKENTFESKTIPEPTFADKRNIVQAVTTAVNASIRIDEHDKASGVDEQKAALTELMGTLKHAWNAAQAAKSEEGA